MTALINKGNYRSFVQTYSPSAWDRNDGELLAEDAKGKHSLLISLERFWRVLEVLGSIERLSPIRSVIDVGPYPGSVLHLMRNFLGTQFEYVGVGLGFSDAYRTEMEKLGAKTFATELDPDFFEAKQCLDWPKCDADVCLFLDVIEHLVNPVHCLDNINASLRMGGRLILTTDNITSFSNAYLMFKLGRSPNMHPADTCLFYRGDWRPHFREFSRDELFFYLDYCGFRVAEHQFFERKQGDFYITPSGKIAENPRHRGIKGLIQAVVKNRIPHLRDHQILVAEKVKEHAEVSVQRPQIAYSVDDWLHLRRRYGAL